VADLEFYHGLFGFVEADVFCLSFASFALDPVFGLPNRRSNWLLVNRLRTTLQKQSRRRYTIEIRFIHDLILGESLFFRVSEGETSNLHLICLDKGRITERKSLTFPIKAK
jgi:hypothetical protein